jgi:hypothetical protein
LEVDATMSYKGKLMAQSLLCLLLLATSFSSAQAIKEIPPGTIKDRVAGLQRQDGFLP